MGQRIFCLKSFGFLLFATAFGGILISASDAGAQRSSPATKPTVTPPTAPSSAPGPAPAGSGLSPSGISCPSVPRLALANDGQGSAASGASALTAPVAPNTVVVTEKAKTKEKRSNPFGGVTGFLKKNAGTVGSITGLVVGYQLCPRLISSGVLPGVSNSDCMSLLTAAGQYFGTEAKKEFDMQDTIKVMSARSKAIETGQPQRIQLSRNRTAVMETPVVVNEGRSINVFHSAVEVPISTTSVGVELNRLVTKQTKLLGEPKSDGRQLALLANECPVRVVGFDKEAVDFALVANGPVVLGYVAAADIAKEGSATATPSTPAPTPVPVPAKGKSKKAPAPAPVVRVAQPRIPAGFSPRTLTTVRCNREVIKTTSGETGEVKDIVQTICEDPTGAGAAFGAALRL